MGVDRANTFIRKKYNAITDLVTVNDLIYLGSFMRGIGGREIEVK